METMKPKPGIEPPRNPAEHTTPGRRILGTPDTAGEGIEDDLTGKVGPDPSNQLPVTRPDGVHITPHGLGGDSGNGTRCILHDNQTSLHYIEKI